MPSSLNEQLNTAKPEIILEFSEILRLVGFVLGPERSFYTLAVIYSIAISLLTLAVPVSVQALITSVANTGVPQAVGILAGLLFAVLSLSSILVLLRHYLMERLQRRLYARLSHWMSRELLQPNRRDLHPHNEAMLVTRYFDIMTLKTHVPELLVGGVSLLLQTAAGAVLVSFYHPLLLMFCALLVFSIYLIWRAWGPAATRSSVALSHAKYNTSEWLHRVSAKLASGAQSVDRSALAQTTDQFVKQYLQAHTQHFRHHFQQVIAFAVLYAVANAALLGLGGYLVIVGELTLGQLVAAELILSVILINLAQFGYYLDKFYDICAAAEEVSMFKKLAVAGEIADTASDADDNRIPA